MAIEARWIEVVHQVDVCRQLTEDWSALIDNCPETCEHWPADQISDTAQELLGWLQETVSLTRRDGVSTHISTDPGNVRRTLTLIQRVLDRIVTVEGRIRDELERLGQVKPRERSHWTKWLRHVREDWRRLEHATQLFTKEIVACWQDLADHVSQPHITVSIHNENHGYRSSVIRGPSTTTQ